MPTDAAPEEQALAALQQRGLRLATAESCTGGLLAARLTRIPGASGPFAGGVVAYTDAAKTALVGVDAAILRAHGAVSETTTRALAEGIRKRLGADIGLAITGWAGPSAPTPPERGLVHLALATPAGTRVQVSHFAGERTAVREAATDAALGLLLSWLKEDRAAVP